MMRWIAAAFVVALAACTQPASPPVVPETQTDAPAPPAITGAFVASSTTAMGVTGDLEATPDVLSFALGFRIEGGRIDAALTGDTDLSAGGGTIADGSGVHDIASVELRRVQEVRIAADARNPNLCGGQPVTHIILARGSETLSLLVFSGADAPGPNAHDTQLCGIYNYTPE